MIVFWTFIDNMEIGCGDFLYVCVILSHNWNDWLKRLLAGAHRDHIGITWRWPITWLLIIYAQNAHTNVRPSDWSVCCSRHATAKCQSFQLRLRNTNSTCIRKDTAANFLILCIDCSRSQPFDCGSSPQGSMWSAQLSRSWMLIGKHTHLKNI